MNFVCLGAKVTNVISCQTVEATSFFIVWFPSCNKDLSVKLETKLDVSYDNYVMGF